MLDGLDGLRLDRGGSLSSGGVRVEIDQDRTKVVLELDGVSLVEEYAGGEWVKSIGDSEWTSEPPLSREVVTGGAPEHLEKPVLDGEDLARLIRAEEAAREAGGERGDDRDTVSLDINLDVVRDRSGVRIERWKEVKNGGAQKVSDRQVIMGHFKPLRRLDLDEETVFEVETRNVFRGNANEIMGRLREEGLVVCSGQASDAVNALLSGLQLETVRGHSTYGVYEEDGRLTVCLDPEYRDDRQEQVARALEGKTDVEATKEDLEAWLQVPGMWHRWEVFPIMGLAAIAPFGYVLRGRGVMVPYLYHLSPESGVGKSETLEIYVNELFGKPMEGGSDTIDSAYRLADALNHYGGLIGVEEGENFRWHRWSAHLQQAVERPIQDQRGTGALGSRAYLSRATLAFSGNAFPTKKKALLTRFIVVNFDRQMSRERARPENKRELKRVRRRLRPIGWRIVEAHARRHGTLESLVRSIDEHEERIEDVYPTLFEDARRPRAWAVLYEGLRAWESLASEIGHDWTAPTVEEFVEGVVIPVEAEAFDVVEAPAQQFAAWWQGWKAKNTHQGIIKGEDEVWRRKTVTLPTGEEVEGDYITTTVLDWYERENRYKGEWISMTLKDLRRGVESLTGITDEDVPDTAKIGGKPQRGAFVPDTLLSAQACETPPQEDNVTALPSNDRGARRRFQGNAAKKHALPGNQQQATGQEKGNAVTSNEPGGRYPDGHSQQAVIRMIRDYVSPDGYHPEIPQEEVIDHLEDEGVERERAQAVLDHLASAGDIVRWDDVDMTAAPSGRVTKVRWSR